MTDDLPPEDNPRSAPYADVKILAILAAINAVIFVLAFIGALDVVHTAHEWLAHFLTPGTKP